MYSPSSSLVVQHLAHLDGVHRRVPRHVGHEDQQRVDRVRVAAPGVGDDVVHHARAPTAGTPTRTPCRCAPACRRRRRTGRRARPASRAPGRRAACSAGSPAAPLGVFAQGGIGRGNGALWRKPPGRSMVPSSVIRIASARMVWKPLECAASPRIAWNATGLPVTVSCSLPQHVGPGDRQLDLLVARGDAHLVREAPDGLGRDAGDAGRPLGRVVLDALLQQLERGLDRACRRAAGTRRAGTGRRLRRA